MKTNLLGLAFMSVFLLFTGCAQVQPQEYIKYTIKENNHLGPKPARLFSRYYVKFDSTIRYNHGDADQLDLNKLPGRAPLGLVHNDSKRMGFRYNIAQDRVDLYRYDYVAGERIFQEPLADSLYYGSVAIGEEILIDYGSGFFCNTRLYFGGDKRAPHDINIYIKQTN